jgi:hypothetical protein
VHSMLQKDPAQRIQSVVDVAQQLRALPRTTDPSQPPFVPPRARRAAAAAANIAVQPTSIVPRDENGSELLFSNDGRGQSAHGSGQGSASPVFAASAARENSVSSIPLPEAGFSTKVESARTSNQRPPAQPAGAPAAASVAVSPVVASAEVAQEFAALAADGFNLDALPSTPPSKQPWVPAHRGEPGQQTMMRMLDAELNAEPVRDAMAAALPAAVAPSSSNPAAATASTDYHDEDRPTPSQRSVVLPPPTFQAAATRASPKEVQAKKSMLMPAAIAGSLAVIGFVVITTFELPKSSGAPVTGGQGAVMTAEESAAEKAKAEAAREMKALEDERRKAEAEEKQRQALLAAAMANPRPAPVVEALPEPPSEPLPPVEATRPAPRLASSSTRPAAGPAPAPAPAPVDNSPWGRFGSRTSNTGATVGASSPTAASSSSSGRRAGTRIPVRVNNVLVSSPAGPVIATVTQTTSVGDITLPAGTEIHGTTSGAAGTRLLVTFTTAIVGGKNIPLSGTALGLDGQSGIPAVPSGADGTDVVAGAAAATVNALGAAAAEAVGGVPGAAIEGASSPAAGNTSRINTSRTTVSTKRGVRFLIYVNS